MKKVILLAFLLALTGSAWAGFSDPYIGEVPTNWATSSKVTVTASPTAWGLDANYGPQLLVNGGAFTVIGGEKHTDGIHHTYNADTHTWIANHGNGAYTSPAGVACSAWVQFVFDQVYPINDMDIWNGGMDNDGSRSFQTAAIHYSTDGVTWRLLGGTNKTLTRGGALGTHQWFAPSDPSVPFYARAKYVVFSGISNYGATDAYMISEVRFYIYNGHVEQAGFPSPTDSAIRISTSPTLGWVPGASAAAHDVYFGTTFDAVTNAIRLKGDMNGDGKVNFLDFAAYAGQWQLSPSGWTADLNDDGVVDLFDMSPELLT